MNLSAIVLTRNEEADIGSCLGSLSFADEILVVDSGSTDRTVEIAEKSGARVVRHPMKDFSDQRNFAMLQAKGNWVLFIDADERVSSEAADEIRAAVNGPALSAYAILRHTYFFGKRLRFCDAAGDAPVRLFPKARARWEQPVHETVVTDLPLKRMRNPILHYSTRDLSHYKQKVRDYIPLELLVMRGKGQKPGLWKALFLPPARFLQLYFLKLGILDGIAGLQYAILSSYYTWAKHWRFYRLGGRSFVERAVADGKTES